MALDSYPPIISDYESYENPICLAFNIVFLIDLIVKFIACGPKNFVKDNFNIFDSLVIACSLALFAIQRKSGSAISALRTFRLMRIIHFIKRWETLQLLLQSIANTISTISNFILLVALFIYVYALLGMQFFAG